MPSTYPSPPFKSFLLPSSCFLKSIESSPPRLADLEFYRDNNFTCMETNNKGETGEKRPQIREIALCIARVLRHSTKENWKISEENSYRSFQKK